MALQRDPDSVPASHARTGGRPARAAYPLPCGKVENSDARQAHRRQSGARGCGGEASGGAGGGTGAGPGSSGCRGRRLAPDLVSGI